MNDCTPLFSLKKDDTLPPRIATWVSMMGKVRQKLLKTVEPLTDEEIDYTPDEKRIETIGTLLLHIAAVEWSWIFEDIDGKKMDYERWKHAFALRPDVNLPQLKHQGKKFYLTRLSAVRTQVYQRLQLMKDSELDTIVGDTYTIEWILFHLVEHEALHLGQISVLSRLYKRQ
jgi:uncharacterized damage-inducible protein DinB